MASSNSTNYAFDPLTNLGPGLTALLLLIVALIALPGAVLGLVAHRFTRALPWRVSLLLWLLLAFASGYALYLFWEHGLDALFTKEIVAYGLAFSHAHFNLLKMPFAQLWPDTWPVWVRTLASAPLIGFMQEVFSQKPLHADPAQAYLARERRRQRANTRATARIRHPHHLRRLPTSILGTTKKGPKMMVMGVALDDEDEE